MMIKHKLIGIDTGKVYAEGTKQECFRKLQLSNPSLYESNTRPKRGGAVEQVYPEPLKLVRA